MYKTVSVVVADLLRTIVSFEVWHEMGVLLSLLGEQPCSTYSGQDSAEPAERKVPDREHSRFPPTDS